MAHPPHRPPTLAWQIFRGTAAVQRGLLTAHQLRGPAWVRLCRDVYADSRLAQTHALRCRGAALLLPTQAIFAGPSAAHLYGVAHAATFDDDVHVIVPRAERMGSRNGLRIHTAVLDEREVGQWDGLTLTTPSRTAWDLAAWLDVVPAVAAIDGLLHGGLVDEDDLAVQLRRGSARLGPGSRRARRAFGLVDGRAQSPSESCLRVRLVLAGLPAPAAQCPVRLPDDGIAYPDLAWLDFQVAIDYDGPWRGELIAAGWEVLHVTSERLQHDFDGLEKEVRETLEASGWQPTAGPRERGHPAG